MFHIHRPPSLKAIPLCPLASKILEGVNGFHKCKSNLESTKNGLKSLFFLPITSAISLSVYEALYQYLYNKSNLLGKYAMSSCERLNDMSKSYR